MLSEKIHDSETKDWNEMEQLVSSIPHGSENSQRTAENSIRDFARIIHTKILYYILSSQQLLEYNIKYQ